jgi:SAM-dependent MidA family methyltransferase
MQGGAHIYMLETSPCLRQQQANNCRHVPGITWITALDELPGDMPVLATGNEFLDALPVHQFQFRGGQWYERVVGLDDNNALTFGLSAVPEALGERMPDMYRDDNSVYEIAPQREAFVQDLCARLAQQGGACLFVDYGYAGPANGDTLQAVRGHKFCDPLADPGECDITSHVDFAPLRDIAYHYGLKASEPVPQKIFLKRLGIDHRYAMLDQNCSPAQREELQQGYKRLMDEDQMGRIFKAFSIYSPSIQPGGCEHDTDG